MLVPAVHGSLELMGPIRSCYCRPGKFGVLVFSSCRDFEYISVLKLVWAPNVLWILGETENKWWLSHKNHKLPENCKRWRPLPLSWEHTLRVWDSTALILDFAFSHFALVVYRQQRGPLYLRVQKLPMLPAHPPFSRFHGCDLSWPPIMAPPEVIHIYGQQPTNPTYPCVREKKGPHTATFAGIHMFPSACFRCCHANQPSVSKHTNILNA